MKAPRSGRARLLTAVVSAAVVGAAVAGYLALTAGPATARQFATLTVLEGTVEVQETGTPGFRPGATGDTLRQGDVVRTGDDGKADIEFFDGSVTRLDVGTELRLKELASVPDVPDSKTIVSDQSSGKTLNRVVELTDSESRFETETPNAVASVRGTEYVTIVYPNGSSEYWVLSGTLIILLADGTTVELNAGQGVFVDPEGNAGEIFEVTDAEVEALCELDPEFCSDEVEGTEIEEEDGEEEGDDVQGTTVTREETDDDVTLIPPLVIIRDDPPPGDNDPPETTIEDGPDDPSDQREAAFIVSSSEPATFECSLDDGDFGECPEPVEAASRASLAVGDELLSEISVSYGDPGLFPDGPHTFRARATDAAGNTGSPDTFSWNVDAPPSTWFSSVPLALEETGDATFDIESDEADVTFECSLDGEEFDDCPVLVALDRTSTALPSLASITVHLFDLPDGERNFRARAVNDKVADVIAEYTWTVEAKAPTTTITSGPEDDSTTFVSGATFAFEADESPVTFECRLDEAIAEVEALGDDGWEGCESPQSYHDLEDGTHTFEVRATDGFDKVGPVVSRSWTVDLAEDIYVTLEWTEGPRDLDLHLLAPNPQPNGQGHVYHGNLCHPPGPTCWAQLQGDMTNGPPGSEEITLRPSNPGFPRRHAFTVYVNNYSWEFPYEPTDGECDEPFSASDAKVTISGSNFEPVTFNVPSTAGDATQWNVATFLVLEDGTIDPDEDGTVADEQACPSFAASSRHSKAGLLVSSAPSTLEIHAEPANESYRVRWLPKELEGEVRVSTEEFPDEITDGELGCRGIGRCVIEDVEPGTTLYLTVFPAGVTALDPVEDVTSVRVVIPPLPEPSPSPDPEPEPAVENDPPPDGSPPEDPEPTPEPTPSPSPPPAE